MVLGLRALAEDCMRDETIPPSVRGLLASALSTAPPPRTVRHLARLIHADPSTIRRHWRRGVNSRGIQRVKDLLDWLVLLRAVSLKGSGLSWRLVSEGIGAHESTLRRRAERLAGDTLGSLGSLGADRLLECFTETLRESFCAQLR